MRRGSRPARPTTWGVAGVRLALLVLAMAGTAVTLVSVAPPGLLRPGDGTAGAGPTALAFIGVYALGTCVFIPKPALSAVAGILFGLPVGLLVAVLGNTGGALLGYGAARLLGSDALRLMSARSRHVEALRERLARRPFTGVLWLRLTPGMPFAAVSVAAGSSRLPVLPFAAATALGTLPATGACVAMGTAASSLSSPVVWGPFAAAVAVFGAVVLVRRKRTTTTRPGAGPGTRAAVRETEAVDTAPGAVTVPRERKPPAPPRVPSPSPRKRKPPTPPRRPSPPGLRGRAPLCRVRTVARPFSLPPRPGW